MARQYIKNCTGDQCEKGNKNSRIVLVIIFYILTSCFIGVSVYILFFSQYLQISNIIVTGTQELSSQEIKQNIEASLQGNFLGVIPKNNFLFVSQKKNEKPLLDNYKKIRAVSITKKFPDTINISIDERKALLVWCSGKKCYLLDENGVAYNEADFASANLTQNNLLQINDTSGKEVTISSKIIEPSYEQYVLGIKDALVAAGFNVTGQYYTPSRMAEEIDIKTDQDLEFYFSTQFPLESALRTLDVVLKKEITKDKIGDIAYIDLRNENKVFYKFKNAQPATESTQTVIPN